MPVSSITLNRILTEVAKKEASALHLFIGGAPTMRVNGKLEALRGENIVSIDLLKEILNSVLNEEERKQLKQNKEICVVKNFEDLRFKVKVFYQKGFPSLTLNYINRDFFSTEELRLPEKLVEITRMRSGLLLITGTNGSGKTTSVSSLIENLNQQEKKYIITIEDPIEYLFINKVSIIEQRQIGRDLTSCQVGIKHCLEEDVDLVYINNIKTNFSENIFQVLELALGNALVILEINSDNCAGAIEKILSITKTEEARRSLANRLAKALLGCLAQRMIPGRIGKPVIAFEFLIVNSSVQSFIKGGNTYQIENVIQTSKKEGMVSMEKSIEHLLETEQIRREDI